MSTVDSTDATALLSRMLLPTPGLRVLVTGGTSGLGAVIADTLASFGASVVVCGSDSTRLERYLETHPRRVGLRCDVTLASDVAALFAACESLMGGLDVLVNNAGIAGPTAAIGEISDEEWDQTIAVNLTGAFKCSRAAVPMLTASQGAIINISSVAGRLGYALRSPYCASKFGLAGLTESLARELGPGGVRVNSVLPGFVDSDRLARTTQARADALGVGYAEVEDHLLSKTSLHTKVSEQEVALLVAYLCSPAARPISGQSLSICGNVEYL